jgi:peptidylprolyl isomerase/FKBP-type peptidyl-prolyl cis-trans isomerase FklB
VAPSSAPQVCQSPFIPDCLICGQTAPHFHFQACRYKEAMNKLSLAALVSLLACACATAPAIPTPPATAPGPDFLVRNAAAKNVVTTPSGLQYFIVRSGPETGQRPGGSDTVTFDYEGKLVTGETFDSSYERGTPLTGRIDGFVPGFTEALKLMRPGDEWIVWIPPALGYGDRASGPIPANSVLRFRLALHSVTPSAAAHPTL